MRTKYAIMAILMLLTGMVHSQSQYKVARNTYLKKNPDAYSDNISFIPEGTTIFKVASTDYPYFLVKYNGEDGYVNRLDLTTQTGTSSSPETFPLEEPEIEEPPIVEPEVERENEPSEEVVKESWKSWLVLPQLPKFTLDKKYLWGLLIIPVLFLTLLILSLLRSRKRKVNLQEDYYSSLGNQENKNFWDQQDKTSWEQQDKTIHNQQEKTTFDNTYSEPIKVHRWQDFPGKDDKTIIDR